MNKSVSPKVLFLVVCAIALGVLPVRAQGKPSAILSRDFSIGDYEQAIADYAKLSEAERQNPRNCYLAAQAHLRRYDFLAAEPLLLVCKNAKFSGFWGWESTSRMLKRIHTLKSLCPPFYKEFSSGKAVIEVSGREPEHKNDWLDSIYQVMPDYVKRAQEAFGEKTPKISFYMFEDLSAYKDFYHALFFGHTPKPTQAGTGNTNVVVFCQFLPNGKICGENDMTFRRGCVVHEYGHALCTTIYGDSYAFVVPPWVNEGMADLFASPFFGSHFDQEPKAIVRAKAGHRKSPPTYRWFVKHFYKDSTLAYALGKLMIADVFENQNIGTMDKILEGALEKGGDFPASIKQVTGKDVHDVYNEVISKYWQP